MGKNFDFFMAFDFKRCSRVQEWCKLCVGMEGAISKVVDLNLMLKNVCLIMGRGRKVTKHCLLCTPLHRVQHPENAKAPLRLNQTLSVFCSSPPVFITSMSVLIRGNIFTCLWCLLRTNLPSMFPAVRAHTANVALSAP